MKMYIYACCDDVYFREHGKSFLVSAAAHGNSAHVDIINASSETIQYATDLVDAINRKFSDAYVSTSSIIADRLTFFTESQKKVYYSCARFIHAPMRLAGSVLVSDIDSLIMRHIPEPEYDLGLFHRNPLPGTVGWEREGTRIAAGLFYYNPKMKWFADQVRTELILAPPVWFADQVSLNKVYRRNEIIIRANYKDHCFTSDEMDWEFREGTMIWTGKGPRKYDNPKYVAQKKAFENEIRDPQAPA